MGGIFQMTIIELREKRAKAWEAAKAFLDTKRGGDGILSAEDGAVYDKMEADIVNLGNEIERLEKLAAMGNELRKATSVAVTNSPGITPGTPGGSRARSTNEYRNDFWDSVRGREFGNSLKVGSDPDGGYLVPDEFERILIEALEEENLFRKLATIIRTDSGERQIPVVANRGTAAWVEEEAVIPESDNTFGQITLNAYKIATLIKASSELLNDSFFDIESYIAKEFARRIGVKEEEAFFVGDGNKRPTGILAASGGGAVAVTAASATAITFDEVFDLYYALKSPYRTKAAFITNDMTMKELRKLKDENGQYLWQPAIRESTPDMIVGKPIHTSSFVPEMAAGVKSLVFGDFSYYWIADRLSRTFQRLNELYAVTGQVGFIATQRVDGKLILPEAVQVLQMGA
jgi:HK97 family phage major capsid protein